MRLPMASGARLLAVHLDARLPAANRRPEVHRRLVLEIRPRLRTPRPLRMLRPGEDSGKNVLEAAPPRRTRPRLLRRLVPRPAKAGEVEALEVHRRPPARA